MNEEIVIHQDELGSPSGGEESGRRSPRFPNWPHWKRALKWLVVEGNTFANTLRLSGWTACCGLLVHSLVDFNLHIPANLLLFLLMSVLATARMEQQGPAGRRRRADGKP